MKKDKGAAKENEVQITQDDFIEGPVKLPEKKKKLGKKTIWAIVGAALIVLVIILVNSANAKKAAAAQTYQTEKLKRGDLVALVGATGNVRANQSTSLYWQVTGRIDKINVAVGDKVNAGDVLATLAPDSLPQSVISAQAQLFSAKQKLEDTKNSNAAKAAAAEALAEAQRAYNTALANYWDAEQTQGSEDQIELTRAQWQLAENKVKDLQKAYDKLKELKDTDTRKAQALANLTQAKIDRDKVKRLLDYYEALPDAIDVELLKAKLDLAKANLDDAQREYDRLKDGPDPDEVAAAEANVKALEATIALAQLTAPFSGTITEVNSMAGDQITSGTITFRIDDMSKILVDIQVPEVDINSIAVGQSATLTFDAIQNNEYQGVVTEVARVGDSVGGVVQFKVTLQILNPDVKVLPGMTAAVNIAVQDKKDVLLAPNRSIRLVNDQYVIYVIRDGMQVMVPITIGATSDSYSEIASGDVKEGDEIILNPSTSLIDMMQSQQSSQGMSR